MKKRKPVIKPSAISSSVLFADIKDLIQQARARVCSTVNSELVLLYWRIGKRIRTEILKDSRADYGVKMIRNLARYLIKEFGDGFGEKQLRHCLRVAETFPNEKIVYALSRQLSWTHLRTLAYIENVLKREFYLEICKRERWSSRQLQERIDSMLYERTAISRKPERLIMQEIAKLRKTKALTPDFVFRDPYILNFLGLKDTYSEADLESAILSELQKFMTEFGPDFAFIARQKRIVIDGEDYYIDLLFFHRGLKRIVVVDLKLGKFKPAYKSQMELYLKWLEKYEMRDGEEQPIGLVLCADKSDEHIELLQLHKGNIRVAQYLTELPPKKLLREKLHKAIQLSRKLLAKNCPDNALPGK